MFKYCAVIFIKKLIFVYEITTQKTNIKIQNLLKINA